VLAGCGSAGASSTPKNGVTVAWLRHVDGAGRTVDVDPVEFFVGTDAARESQRDGKEGSGDTYIRNPSPKLLRLQVTDAVAITVNELRDGGPTDGAWTWSQLTKVTDTRLRGASLFRLQTVDGRVTSMSQQYLP
jgi:hypothetical protein